MCDGDAAILGHVRVSTTGEPVHGLRHRLVVLSPAVGVAAITLRP
jgi:hypothetical protein